MCWSAVAQLVPWLDGLLIYVHGPGVGMISGTSLTVYQGGSQTGSGVDSGRSIHDVVKHRHRLSHAVQLRRSIRMLARIS